MVATAYLPAQQAYISDQVKYDQSGRALASVDIAFAGSGIVGFPLAGWAIELWGWRIPLVIIGILTFVAAAFIWMELPRTEIHTKSTLTRAILMKASLQSNVQASMGVALLAMIGNGIYISIWSIWLSADYGFDAV
ncbi:MAG: MFS transporter [Anaerolineales bacterium]|nr:MFS transporter [Chloroflexota bacterium]MBL6983755.1 MFS transporter [Anaerolineales bacterium]